MSEVSLLAEKLEKEGMKIHSLFSQLKDNEWDVEVYTEDGRWTVRDVLCHFVTSDTSLVQLFERIRSGGKGIPDDFSVDDFNAVQLEQAIDFSPHELMDLYLSARAQSVKWVLSLRESDLEITGHHPYLRHTTLREMIKMFYLHHQIHYRDIRRALHRKRGPLSQGMTY